MPRVSVFLLLVVSACTPNWADPVLSVEDLQLEQMSLTGATLEITLGAYNPNSVALPFESVDYEIRIGDSDPVTGTAVFDQPLPALESVPLTTTVHIPMTSAVSIGRQLAAGQGMYHLRGTMTLEYRGRREVEFEREGELSDLLATSQTPLQ